MTENLRRGLSSSWVRGRSLERGVHLQCPTCARDRSPQLLGNVVRLAHQHTALIALLRVLCLVTMQVQAYALQEQQRQLHKNFRWTAVFEIGTAREDLFTPVLTASMRVCLADQARYPTTT